MKILVTGGAGFIGSHIVDRYISLGHEVAVVDDLSTGNEAFLNPKAKFYRMDISRATLKHIFKKEKPDLVNHHAAQIDVRKSVADPVKDAKINILGSINIIQCCITCGVKKIIFASSGGAAYGEPKSLPVDETHPTDPTSPYGAAKLAIEKYLFAVSTYSPLKYIALRYGNVYGPRQSLLGEAGVCSIFINNMLKNKHSVLYGYGSPVRDYVYAADIAEANVSALDEKIQGVYNIGTSVGTKVAEIYEMLKNITGCSLTPEQKPLRPGELQGIYLDYSKAKNKLGWAPKVSFKEGLKRTVEYFKNS